MKDSPLPSAALQTLDNTHHGPSSYICTVRGMCWFRFVKWVQKWTKMQHQSRYFSARLNWNVSNSSKSYHHIISLILWIL